MTEHMPIQNPDDYGEEKYRELEIKLFSPYTDVSELKTICMTLAHIPAKRAQNILAKFKKSERASEVEWLETALDEGRFHYLSPQNELEERDYLALKVMQELEDRIIELERQHDEFKLDLEKNEIEHEAICELVRKGELENGEEPGFHDYRIVIHSQMEDLASQISVKHKILNEIKNSIKTDRYKDVDPMHMRNIHFC